jgi:antitoxin MazE
MPRAAIKARIVAIGNSQGVRIPKPLLEQAGLAGEVELHAEDGRIVIAAVRQPRSGWADAAAALHARGEDGLLDTPAPAFDHEEWTWR